MAPEDRRAAFALDALVRFADQAVDAMSRAREEIDSLNVYPVPDGDTGTNLFLTLEAARDALAERVRAEPDAMRPALRAYARGALLGARGNSGVILSQLLGALLRRVAVSDPEDPPAAVFADGFALATEAAYAAVGTPVEGTMLSVARAGAEAAREFAEGGDAGAGDPAADPVGDPVGDLADGVAAAARGAWAALARTPDQLERLREAGVVDAGGAGLCVLLDALETTLTGRRPLEAGLGLTARPRPQPGRTGDLSADGPGYEVMYLLDADEEAIPSLRQRLAPLGDSLVVVGTETLWNVHVHVDDVGAAIEAGIAAGRPRRIQVTHFAEQAEGTRLRGRRTGRAVVAVAAGDGLGALFAQAGAKVVVNAPDARVSTGDVLDVILSAGTAEVIVLPNDPDGIGVAEAAAREAQEQEIRTVVIPTRAQVQGLAALAVHAPDRAFDADVVSMTASARGVRDGAVTVALRDAMTSAGPCRAGDALGVVRGDFAEVGTDLDSVALAVVERLLSGGGELVTLVAGADGGALSEHCAAHIRSSHPGVDVEVYDGGQTRYPLLIGVE